MSAPGLPELCSDLGLHFQHVAALFGERIATPPPPPPPPVSTVVSAPLLPVVDVVVTQLSTNTVEAHSPSADFPPFWLKHQALHSFLLISFAAFVPTMDNLPVFAVTSVDTSYKPGFYCLRDLELQYFFASDKKWKALLTFPDANIPLLTRQLPKSVRYFKLSNNSG
jgi:hypothetical protein